MLSQLADDSYARRRNYDLTRAIAGEGMRAQPGHGRRRGSRAAGTRSRLALPVAGVAIAARRRWRLYSWPPARPAARRHRPLRH